MEISFSEARPGDILVVRRNPNDKVSGIITWVLKRLDRDFASWTKRKKVDPWHTAPITNLTDQWRFPLTARGKKLVGLWVMDAQMGGAREIYYGKDYIAKECKIYRWLDESPTSPEIESYIKAATGASYDIKAYFSTIFFYFIAKITKQNFRVHDKSYHCWELTSLAMRMWGKELQDITQYPLISRMIRTLDG